jgi:DNA replication protein DnaC
MSEVIEQDTTQHAAAAFNRLTERLKATPHQPLGNPSRASAIERLKQKWNAPERHARRKPDELAGEQWKAKLDSLKSKLGTGCLIAFVGKRGPGKTQMAVELMRHQVENRLQSALYCKALEIFCSIRESYGDGGKRELKAIEHWVSPELLVIDEAQVRAETDFEQRILTHLLDKRYDNLKDTIVIANLTRQELFNALGVSIEARLAETGGITTFEWESFRP